MQKKEGQRTAGYVKVVSALTKSSSTTSHGRSPVAEFKDAEESFFLMDTPVVAVVGSSGGGGPSG
jgi:hypothetical protein